MTNYYYYYYYYYYGVTLQNLSIDNNNNISRILNIQDSAALSPEVCSFNKIHLNPLCV